MGLEKSTQAINYDYLGEFSATDALAWRANGDFNVYGPKKVSFRYDLNTSGDVKDFMLFYADDSEGRYLSQTGREEKADMTFTMQKWKTENAQLL